MDAYCTELIIFRTESTAMERKSRGMFARNRGSLHEMDLYCSNWRRFVRCENRWVLHAVESLDCLAFRPFYFGGDRTRHIAR